MGVEVYQGTIAIGSNDTYQQAVKEIFTMAGYSVTPDATNHKVTVDAGGNVFGHETFKLGNIAFSASGKNQLVMLVDKDQHVMIVSTAKEIADTFNTAASLNLSLSARSIACLLVGDIDRGDISDGSGTYATVFNIPALQFTRVNGQPCIVVPCIDSYRENLAPVFIAANGVVYPLGTYVTDGSTKFVSNGNGLLIKVKEQ